MAVLFAVQLGSSIFIDRSVEAYAKSNDRCLKTMREFLYGVKGIKAVGLEKVFHRKIEECRAAQLRPLATMLRLSFCLLSSMSQMIPGVTAAATFTVYWWGGHALTADVIFPVLTLFDMIYEPAYQLSLGITGQFIAFPCLKRLCRLMIAEESQASELAVPSEETAIEFRNAVFKYPFTAPKKDDDGDEDSDDQEAAQPLLQDQNESKKFSLGPITVSIPQDKLTIVTGPVGSGKSTILAAIAGSLPAEVASCLRLSGSKALYTQDPWVYSATVKENIIFLAPFDEQRYRDAIRKTCLEEDLTNFPQGDMTLIGETGTNLSGGQRARVALARVVYSQADIVLLDDPLAAVDTKIGQELFHECIRRLPQTVVLVTHHHAFIPFGDNVIVLKDGLIISQGPPEKLGVNGTRLLSNDTLAVDDEELVHSKNLRIETGSNPESKREENQSTPAELLDDEDRAMGSVNTSLYFWYGQYAGGKGLLVVVFAVLCLTLTAGVGSRYWFVWWLEDEFRLKQSTYMAGYIGLISAEAVFSGKCSLC